MKVYFPKSNFGEGEDGGVQKFGPRVQFQIFQNLITQVNPY